MPPQPRIHSRYVSQAEQEKQGTASFIEKLPFYSFFKRRGTRAIALLGGIYLIFLLLSRDASGPLEGDLSRSGSNYPQGSLDGSKREPSKPWGRAFLRPLERLVSPSHPEYSARRPNRCAAPVRSSPPQHVLSDEAQTAHYESMALMFTEAWADKCDLDHDKFTLLMTTSNTRIGQVKQNLKTWTSGKVPSIAAVYIRWIGDLPTEPIYDPETSQIPVEIYHNHNGSLNNRWLPIPDLKTAYVFSHDDDMFIDPGDFEWGWRKSKEFRPAFTSFVGRRWHMDKQHNLPVYKIGGAGEKYGMGTSASWIHSAFMDVYSKHPWLQPVRDVVEETMNCEDLAMAFIVPYLTQVPPILVNGIHNVIHYQYRKSMQSKDQEHWQKRDICSESFYEHFGEMPPERDFTVVRGLTVGNRKIEIKDIWTA